MIWINTWGFKMSHESWRDLALRTLQNDVEFPWNVNISIVVDIRFRIDVKFTSKKSRTQRNIKHFQWKWQHTGTFSEGPTNWDIFRRANSDMGIGPYSREQPWLSTLCRNLTMVKFPHDGQVSTLETNFRIENVKYWLLCSLRSTVPLPAQAPLSREDRS